MQIQGKFRFSFFAASLFALIAMPTAGALRTAAPGSRNWVHGSWVNLRNAPSANAPILSRLSANTEVVVLAKQGDWCEVRATIQSTQGFISCKLIGTQALTLEEVGSPYNTDSQPNPRYSATRAFWLAPSATRLKAAGEFFEATLLTEAQKGAEGNALHYYPEIADYDPAKPSKIIRYPVPEFDAMKAIMQAGVVAAPENRPAFLNWKDLTARLQQKQETLSIGGLWLDEYAQNLARLGVLSPIKPSFFKSTQALAARDTSIEGLSSHFDIQEKLRILGGPRWAFLRHDMPRVHGYWDIGAFELALVKPVSEYIIGRRELASASLWRAVEKHDPTDEYSCEEGIDFPPSARTLLAGYPKVKDPLVWIYTPEPLPFKKVNTKTFAKRVKPTRSNSRDQQHDLKLVVMHDIDLDGDGIADLAVWEGMPAALYSGDQPATRMTLANIAGQWFLIEVNNYNICT